MEYLETLKKNWWAYLLDGVIAIVLINIDLRLFLLAAFFRISFEVSTNFSYLLKTQRLYQIVNEIRINSIIKKLKITKKEIAETTEEYKNSVPIETWNKIDKELSTIIDI